jgi:Skp family chaperone for outer membrane proteins
MKNKLATVILAIAVIVLYILQFSSGNSLDKINTDKLESIESEGKDTSTLLMSTNDTLSIDSLKEADFSRIGFINMFQVVDECPTLKKDIQLLEQKQISLQKKEAQIYKEFETYRTKKEQDLKTMQEKGLLDQMTYQMELKQMQQKQAEAEQKVLQLKPKAENLQKSQLKITQKRNDIVQKALDKINKKLQLDFVLVQDGMNTSVFPLNAKNDITNQIISVVNNQ